MEKVLVAIGTLGLIVLLWMLIRKARAVVTFRPSREIAELPRKYPAPKKAQVARRALCIGAIVLRGSHEARLKDNAAAHDSEGCREAIDRLEDWLTARALLVGLMPNEVNLMSKEAGAWSTEEITVSGCLAEMLGCLCWSLTLVRQMPPYDRRFDPANLLPYLHLTEDGFDLESASKMRTFDLLLREREVAEHWDWRAELREKMERGENPPAGFTYEQIISFAARAGFHGGENGEPIDDDLPAFGKAYRDLSDEEFALVRFIANQRLRAFNWLCGYTGPLPPALPKQEQL